MKLETSYHPSDKAWDINYIKCQIKKIDALLVEYPGNNVYNYVRNVWVERLAKHESISSL
jgi:hypothetical protein